MLQLNCRTDIYYYVHVLVYAGSGVFCGQLQTVAAAEFDVTC